MCILSRVLRAKKGDHLEFSDNEEKRYRAVIENIGPSEAVLKTISEVPIERIFPQITLFLCILKKDAMEIAIQKTVEMGISRIIPVISKRVVVEFKRKEKKRTYHPMAADMQKMRQNSVKEILLRMSWNPVKISEIDTGQIRPVFCGM